jgi:hypothetical protein
VIVLGLSALGLVIATAAVLLRPRTDPAPLAAPSESEVAVQTAPPSEATPAPSPTATSTPPARTRGPLGRPIDLTDIAGQVAEIRGLELRRRLNSRLVEPAPLADKVSELAFSELDPDETRNTEQLLIALRLAPPDIDLAAIVESLYREQILGLYVPEEATLYVRQRGTDSPAQRMTTAHEITHALQDQAYDLVQLQADAEEDDDASLAMLSLVEGDAVLTQQLWSQRHLSAEEIAEAAGETAGGNSLAQAPDYLRASLFFPYAQGGLFVAELYRTGGFDAIDEAFADPPTSTEQIMHPERYQDGDDPQAVPVRVQPRQGWRRASTYEFGEFDLHQMLLPLGEETAATAAEGWDGGTVRSWTRDGKTAVAAQLVFDSDEDAEQVCDALPQWYATVADGESTGPDVYAGDRDHLGLRCRGDRVHFGLAPSPQTALMLAPAP